MNGFFPPSLLTKKKPLTMIPQCGDCGFYKKCNNPKIKPQGNGKKKILIVAESPGKEEDERGRLYVGKSGQYLERILRRNGIEMREDCWLTNSVICKPDGKLLPKHVDFCRPTLIQTIEQLNPISVLLMGSSAVRSLIGWLWKEDPGEIGRWVGWNIPSHRINAHVHPVWHPAYVIRCNDERKDNRLMERIFSNHIGRLLKDKEHPGPSPDYAREVQCLTNPDEILKHLKQFLKRGKPIAFDYETDRLKPDALDSRIVCCGVSDGNTTISFPYTNERVLDGLASLLHSDVPKIGYNLKFENRWTRVHFGFMANNWIWDGMINSHILDNRKGVHSLKFQAFVLLGVESYDDHIKPYLEGEGSNKPNKIRQIHFMDLLKYCGLDALLEYKVAEIQMNLLGKSHLLGR